MSRNYTVVWSCVAHLFRVNKVDFIFFLYDLITNNHIVPAAMYMMIYEDFCARSRYQGQRDKWLYCDPTVYVRCNYMSLPSMPVSGIRVHNLKNQAMIRDNGLRPWAYWPRQTTKLMNKLTTLRLTMMDTIKFLNHTSSSHRPER